MKTYPSESPVVVALEDGTTTDDPDCYQKYLSTWYPQRITRTRILMAVLTLPRLMLLDDAMLHMRGCTLIPVPDLGKMIPACWEVPKLKGMCNAGCAKMHSDIPAFSPVPDCTLCDDVGQAGWCTWWRYGQIPTPRQHASMLRQGHFLEEGEATD